MKTMNRNNEPKFVEILEHIGTITEFQTGWTKEINLVSWNGAIPKIDIRDWSSDHERFTNGCTLYMSEAKVLYEALDKYFNRG